MTNPHPSTAPNSFPPESLAEKPSRLLWWLHPKVALPLTLLGLLLVAPFLYRGYRISRVPDIGDPFNVEAFGTVNIAPADNAMTQYALATTLLRSEGIPGTPIWRLRKKRGPKAGPSLPKLWRNGWTTTSRHWPNGGKGPSCRKRSPFSRRTSDSLRRSKSFSSLESSRGWRPYRRSVVLTTATSTRPGDGCWRTFVPVGMLSRTAV